MIRKRLGLWAPILVLAAALVMFAVSTDAVDAARGGKGGGKPGGGTTAPACTTCVLTVSPDPLAAHTQPTVSGTGFTAGKTYQVGRDGDIFLTYVTASSSGTFSFVYTMTDLYVPGQHTMAAYAGSVRVASDTFTVVQ